MLEFLSQTVIIIFNLVNSYLLTLKDHRVRRWAYVLGLAAQPCWFYTTLVHGQWGILVLTLWFTAMYAKGIVTHFTGDCCAES